MAANNSLNLWGSNPSAQAPSPFSSPRYNFGPVSSPYSQALNNISNQKPPVSFAPTTPVKKINNPDGSSTEFHQPQSGLISLPGGGQTTSQGGYAGSPSTNPNYTQPQGQSSGQPSNTTANPITTPGNGFSSTAPVNGNVQGSTGNQQSTGTTFSGSNGQNPVTYPGIISSLATGSETNNSTLGQNAQNIAEIAGQQISALGQGGAAEASSLNSGVAPVGLGLSNQVQNTTAAREQAIAAGANMALAGNQQALTAQGQAQSGLLGAGGLAAPSQTQTTLSPSQTMYGTTGSNAGQPIVGLMAGSGGANSYQTSVSTLASAVQSDQMSYTDALTQLGQYGNPNSPSDLLHALPPGFNVNQSAGTAAAQQANVQKSGQINTAVNSVSAIVGNPNNPTDTTNPNTLIGAFNQLGQFQKTGSTLLTTGINDFINLTGLGNSTQVQNWNRVLAESRARLSSLLQTGVDLGVVGNNLTANSILPNNMTQASLNAALPQITAIEQSIAQAYANPQNSVVNQNNGTTNTGNSTGTTSSWPGWNP